jgi:uncharacterized protein YjbI with pentapeptide repeats
VAEHLTHADLIGANLAYATLTNADLTNTTVLRDPEEAAAGLRAEALSEGAAEGAAGCTATQPQIAFGMRRFCRAKDVTLRSAMSASQ